MSYSNPKIPEGINVTDEHPLKDFAAMLLGIGLALAAIIFVLTLLAGYLVRYVPFSFEQQLAERFSEQLPASENSPEHQQRQEYLQKLGDKLARAQQLPEEMTITVHYLEDDTVNAFATLGGHIFIFKGLLDRMPSENALAMVMAHEIAHIKHRDPMVSLGRGLTVSLAALSLLGAGDGSLAQSLVGQISLLTTLSFSRGMEEDADQEALQTLARHYGHTHHADTLFRILQDENQSQDVPAFFSTHPLNEERIKAIQQYQSEQSPKSLETVPLPAWAKPE
ncbi:M48 family metallopeptidase [Parendozoicomonas haliclonae]|uniref:TPR repeat-containing protein YfgC n=1 Tax=Parendozoicomonas haliclonae TaxID=1960125 RepID=A0A1X7AHK6_9GAMM|nr:M48 family metallopeptidase [Parendozoicomonas haliclonae]SMA43041.1 TPR repeat-containing protein YfgC precursor [Parendozoicomonas haliclonae]